jgi:hypothetical protein
MIPSEGERLEQNKLHEVAKDLQAKGFRVVRRPTAAELPEFLRGFQPDLIAFRGKEGIVVEVKTRRTLATADHLTSLAEVVSSVPGWRLELVLTNPKEKPVAGPADRLDQSDIHWRIGEAKELLHEGSSVAAMLLAWSAAEGALRLLAERAGVALEKNDPGFIIRKLAVNGYLADSDYRVLRPAVDVRNSLVHGFATPQLSPELVEQLVGVADRLMIAPN